MPNSQWWIMEIKMKRVNRIPLFLLALLIAAPLLAQQPARQTDASILSLDTIFTYRPQMLGWHQWQSGGGGQRRAGHRAIRRRDRRKNDSGLGSEPDASGRLVAACYRGVHAQRR